MATRGPIRKLKSSAKSQLDQALLALQHSGAARFRKSLLCASSDSGDLIQKMGSRVLERAEVIRASLANSKVQLKPAVKALLKLELKPKLSLKPKVKNKAVIKGEGAPKAAAKATAKSKAKAAGAEALVKRAPKRSVRKKA